MVINMIFVFKNSFFNYYSNNVIADKVIECMDRVFSSYQEGDHLIWFESYTTARLFFDTNDKITPKIKSIFVAFGSHRQDIATIKNNTKLFVFIEEENFKFCYNENDSSFYVPITYFTTPVKQCKFLSENFSDVDFYMCLSYYLIYKYEEYRHLRGVKLKCDWKNGGGSTSKHALERLALEKSITFGIFDSDKKNLNDSIRNGSTAGGIISVANNYINSNIIGYYILNCREKENLIHPYFWDLFFNHGHSGLNYLANLPNNLPNYINLAFIKYTGKTPMQDLGQFYSSQYSFQTISKDALEKFSKRYLITNEYVINFRNYLTVSNEDIDLLTHILPIIKDDYDNIVQNIFSWTCALDKIIFR